MATAIALLALLALAGQVQAQMDDPAAVRSELALAEQELDVVDLLLEVQSSLLARDYNLDNVRVVDVAAGNASEPMCVEVRQRRVARLSERCAVTPGVTTIDGRSRWLIPGLADMHVHQLESAAGHLLHVAHGVTTVREMDGFPFVLEWRRQAREGTLFAPSQIVVGHILNAMPMGMYATQVTTEQDAREAVRAQIAAGYDAIKIHNVLPEPIYQAIADEARLLGVDFLGHVPHEMTVRGALAAGQWTLEHLKGYIDDRTLRIREDDSVAATRGALAWNAPTFYAHRQYLRDDTMEAWFKGPEARYVPALRLEKWRAGGAEPVRDIHLDLINKKLTVFSRLIEVTDRFLAGSDSGGGYPFMVPGLALHEELRLLADAGLSPLATLRAATVHAAAAARQTGRFGAVVPGARADLVLLAASPLESVAAVRRIEGVMLRGAWLDRSHLDAMLERLAHIQASKPAIAAPGAIVGAEWAAGIVARVRDQKTAGYVHPPFFLKAIAESLRSSGFPSRADELAGR